MKKLLTVLVIVLLAGLVGGAYFAADKAAAATTPVTATAAVERDDSNCLDEEQVAEVEGLTPEELTQWGVDNGLLTAEQVGGTPQGCPTGPNCNEGENCVSTKNCTGPFDTGEHTCPQFSCNDRRTVHFLRCFCEGDGCPLFEETSFSCQF